MDGITEKEMEVVLALMRDYGRDYNANNLSKQVGLTPMGTLKILKRLEAKSILTSKQMGKATFYKPAYDSSYSKKYLAFMLLKEAEESQPRIRRWINELRKLEEHAELAVLFGSVLSKDGYQDVDLLLVLEQHKNDSVNRMVGELNKVNAKKIHAVKQARKDLVENLIKRDKVVANALKSGVVVFGQELLVEVMKDVAR